MWLDQKLGSALSAAAPIGFTNKHLISLSPPPPRRDIPRLPHGISMRLDQRLGPALSAAAPIGFTNKHLIRLFLSSLPPRRDIPRLPRRRRAVADDVLVRPAAKVHDDKDEETDVDLEGVVQTVHAAWCVTWEVGVALIYRLVLVAYLMRHVQPA